MHTPSSLVHATYTPDLFRYSIGQRPSIASVATVLISDQETEEYTEVEFA